MNAMASQITSASIVCSSVCSGAVKENVKAPRHWPLWWEFPGDRWIPRTKRASNAAKVPIWWRRHEESYLKRPCTRHRSSPPCTRHNRRSDYQNTYRVRSTSAPPALESSWRRSLKQDNSHYSDITWAWWSQIIGNPTCVQKLVRGSNKQTLKLRITVLLWGESAMHSSQRTRNRGGVSMLWHNHFLFWIYGWDICILDKLCY